MIVTIVWDNQARNWFDLEPEDMDALADMGDAVAEGRLASEEAVQTVIRARRAIRSEA